MKWSGAKLCSDPLTTPGDGSDNDDVSSNKLEIYQNNVRKHILGSKVQITNLIFYVRELIFRFGSIECSFDWKRNILMNSSPFVAGLHIFKCTARLTSRSHRLLLN